MPLVSLKVNNLRNLKNINIVPSQRLNYIIGENGSGKSSFLEAIFLIGRGRSNRTQRLKELINFDEESLIIHGEVERNSKIRNQIDIGIQNDNIQIKMDKSKIRDRSKLANILPLQLINPASFNLLEGGPNHRREFIDHGLFHMEHTFLDVWKKFNRALKQRNRLLRSGKAQYLSPWNVELAKFGESLTSFRENYVGYFSKTFSETVSELLPFRDYELSYNRGWKLDISLLSFLEEEQQKDLQKCFTDRGPHRADFVIKIEGKPAKVFLSRGQLKILIIALKLTQVRLLSCFTKETFCILVDDLASELGEKFLDIGFDYLSDTNSQLFITGMELTPFSSRYSAGSVFHVEHGNIA